MRTEPPSLPLSEHRDGVKPKHALAVVALEQGYDSWRTLKAAAGSSGREMYDPRRQTTVTSGRATRLDSPAFRRRCVVVSASWQDKRWHPRSRYPPGFCQSATCSPCSSSGHASPDHSQLT